MFGCTSRADLTGAGLRNLEASAFTMWKACCVGETFAGAPA
jgi:hypothetical protein